MTTEFYTTVKASNIFWQQLISKAIDADYPIELIDDEVGFTITATGVPAIELIMELFKYNPEEMFNKNNFI